jgi:hypothetical protein
MIRTNALTAANGLKAEYFCGKAAILLGSDSQAKLKDFISPITGPDRSLRSSQGKFSVENFILMDRLSIFLEWSRSQELSVKYGFQIALRKSSAVLFGFNADRSRGS